MLLMVELGLLQVSLYELVLSCLKPELVLPVSKSEKFSIDVAYLQNIREFLDLLCVAKSPKPEYQ